MRFLLILTGKVNEKFNYKRGKPPDKRRYQLEMSHYTDLIHEKEAIFVSFAFKLNITCCTVRF